MMRIVVVALVAGLLLLAGSASAASGVSRQPFRAVAHPADFVGIGERFVAYSTIDDGPVWVLDTKLGTERQLPLPDGCIMQTGISSGDGHLLVACPDGSRVIDEETGAVAWGPMFATPLAYDWQDNQWMVMGENWLLNYRNNTYVNWHTGEQRAVPGDIRDLDDPNLGKSVFCAPFQKDTRTRYQQQVGKTVLLVRKQDISIARCGKPASVRHLGTGLSTSNLVDGWTTWVSPTKGHRCRTQIFAYDLRRARTIRWQAQPFAAGKCVAGIAQTKYGVLALRVASREWLGSLQVDRYRMVWSRRPG